MMNVISWFRTPNFTVKGRFTRDQDTIVPDDNGDIIQYVFNNETYIHKGEWPIVQQRQATFSIPIKSAIFVDDDTDEVYDVIDVIKTYMGPRHQIENLPPGFCFGEFKAKPSISFALKGFGVQISYQVKYTCTRVMHGTLYFTDILGRRTSCEI